MDFEGGEALGVRQLAAALQGALRAHSNKNHAALNHIEILLTRQFRSLK
jgi:hypothetical protein